MNNNTHADTVPPIQYNAEVLAMIADELQQEPRRPSPSSAAPLPKKAATPKTNLVCFANLIQPAVQEVDDKIKLVQERGGILGIPSPLTRLNVALGGYQEGLHIIAGAPGVGKTAFLLQTAISAAKAGYDVVFVSFELSLSKLVVQAICQNNSLVPKDFLNGLATTAQFNMFHEDAVELQFEEWSKKLHFIEGLHTTSLDDVRNCCIDLQQTNKQKPILLIVDYLQKWARGQQLHQEIRQNVSILGGLLRELAKELQSPVIVVSNQNRSGAGKAEMSSLKESGDVEYDADTLTFLTEDFNNPNTDKINRNVKLSLTKNRFGELIDVSINYRADLGIMTDAYEDAQAVTKPCKRR